MATKLSIDKNIQQKKRGRPPKTEIRNKPIFYEETKKKKNIYEKIKNIFNKKKFYFISYFV
mgnify:CR=1 FL=1